jgi:hypothetical protein
LKDESVMLHRAMSVAAAAEYATNETDSTKLGQLTVEFLDVLEQESSETEVQVRLETKRRANQSNPFSGAPKGDGVALIEAGYPDFPILLENWDEKYGASWSLLSAPFSLALHSVRACHRNFRYLVWRSSIQEKFTLRSSCVHKHLLACICFPIRLGQYGYAARPSSCSSARRDLDDSMGPQGGTRCLSLRVACDCLFIAASS